MDMKMRDDMDLFDREKGEGFHDHNEWYTLADDRWRIVILVIESLLSLTILTGNGLVISAYIRAQKLQNLTHFFLINLAVADFIVGLAIPVKIITQFLYLDHWNSRYLCVIQSTVVATPLGASALCLLLITTERYICITRPYTSKSSLDQNKKLKYILVACVWVISTAVMMITPLLWRNGNNGKGSTRFQQHKCGLVSVVPAAYWKFIVLPLAFAVFAAVFLMYLRILMVARRQIKNIQLLVVQVSKEDKANMQNIRLMKTGFILLGFFLICWLPFTITLTTALTFDLMNERAVEIILVCAATVTTVSSALNPLIYAARIKRFRLELKKILRLAIKNSDKYETYEIRRTFRIKRSSVLASYYNNNITKGSYKKHLDEESEDILTVSASDTSINTETSVKIEVTPSNKRPETLVQPSTQPAKFRSPFRSKTVQEKRSQLDLDLIGEDEEDYIEITITRTITEDMTESSSDEDSLHSDQPIIRKNSLGMAALLVGQVNAATTGKQSTTQSHETVEAEQESESQSSAPAVKNEQRVKRKYRRQVAKSLPLDILCKEDSCGDCSPKTSITSLVSTKNNDHSEPESQPSDEQTLNHFLREMSLPAGNETPSRKLNRSIKASPNHVKFQLDVDHIELQLETKPGNQNRPNNLRLPSVRHLSRKYRKSLHKGGNRKPSPAGEGGDEGAVLTRAKTLNPTKYPSTIDS